MEKTDILDALQMRIQDLRDEIEEAEDDEKEFLEDALVSTMAIHCQVERDATLSVVEKTAVRELFMMYCPELVDEWTRMHPESA